MTTNVTGLLLAWRQHGDEASLNDLISLLYPELCRMAHAYMTRQRPGHTLQTTGLVHETYLQLLDCRQVQWHDRTHFLALAARLMRRILVDYARGRNAGKRGGGIHPVCLDESLDCSPAKSLDLLALDDSLDALAEIDPRKSKVVEMKFFGGLDTHEVAEVLGVSQQTVLRDWKLAKVWLLREMERT